MTINCTIQTSDNEWEAVVDIQQCLVEAKRLDIQIADEGGWSGTSALWRIVDDNKIMRHPDVCQVIDASQEERYCKCCGVSSACELEIVVDVDEVRAWLRENRKDCRV